MEGWEDGDRGWRDEGGRDVEWRSEGMLREGTEGRRLNAVVISVVGKPHQPVTLALSCLGTQV